MEESFENLVKAFENFKQILVNDKYQTIEKFVNFSHNKVSLKNNDIQAFMNNFYAKFQEKIEGLNLSKDINILMKIKLSFTLSHLNGMDNEVELLKLLLKETQKFFNEKLILFNQEIYNLSTFKFKLVIKKIIKKGCKTKEFMGYLSSIISFEKKENLLFNFLLISNILINISKATSSIQNDFMVNILKLDWRKFTAQVIHFNNNLKKFLSNEFAIHKIIEIKNNFLYNYNNIIYNLKNIPHPDVKILVFSCVGEFVDIISNHGTQEFVLEDYYLILQELIEFCFSRTDDNLNQTDKKLLKIIFKVFNSSNPTLHKLTKFFYESRIRQLKSTQEFQGFIDNFLSIFDVLESFNTHLIKVR
jgi:hypothetical protein